MVRHRFIAGAVCPKCGEMDRLVVQPEDAKSEPGVARRYCVSCGYSDERPVGSSPAPRSRLDGGLNRRLDDPATPVDVVRIIDPDQA